MSQDLTPIRKEYYAPIKAQFVDVADERTFTREVSFAVQHIHDNPMLQKATRDSILKAVINIAQVGLSLNPVNKYAYLVPRYNGKLKQMECVLDPSYTGLVKLLTDSGSVRSIEAHIIYEGDKVDFDLAHPKKVISHVPYFLAGNEKGRIIACYSIAVLSDGNFHAEIMSVNDIDEIRSYSESYKAYEAKKIKTCVWVSHYEEMARKTVIKRHSKYLPKSERMDRYHQAMSLDNYAGGYDDAVTASYYEYAHSLILKSTLDEDHKVDYEARLESAKYKWQVDDIVQELSGDGIIGQVDPITAGHNYGQKDIHKHLDKFSHD